MSHTYIACEVILNRTSHSHINQMCTLAVISIEQPDGYKQRNRLCISWEDMRVEESFDSFPMKPFKVDTIVPDKSRCLKLQTETSQYLWAKKRIKVRL